MLSLQQGGSAPILAGIITAAIVSWWRNRK
ncbi:hypothetical protein EA225_16040 [Escherichia coli]|nr:type I toxin-antitoxin system toxin Ldr family protein [Escherichia coli]KAA2028255.1 hypothetical protein EA225_16040 [Escherichia coli]